jgi:hypothetical protein
VAAADQLTLGRPAAVGGAAPWMILGGPALFLAGHAAFKAVIWHRASWPRIAAVAVLALLGLAAPHLSALALSACAAAVVIAVGGADHAQHRGPQARSGSGAAAVAGDSARAQRVLEEVDLQQQEVLRDLVLARHVSDARQRQHRVRAPGGQQGC